MITLEDVYYKLLDVRDEIEEMNQTELEEYVLNLSREERKYFVRIVGLCKKIHLTTRTPFDESIS